MRTRTETATDNPSYRSSKAVGVPATSGRFAIYAWCVLGYNLLVVLWGAYVRASQSGDGCGNRWPMCNTTVSSGTPAIAMFIEFMHRASSGISLLLVAGLVVWAYRSFPKGNLARRFAMLSGVFLIVEALLGAGIVLFRYVAKDASIGRAWWLSIHLVNTFTLLAVLALTAWWASRKPAIEVRPSVSRGLIYSCLAALVALGVSGAIAALADTLFPVTSLATGWAQDFAPTAHIFVRLRLLHPVIAILVSVLVLFTAFRTMKIAKSQAVQNLGLALVMLVFVQLTIGVANLTMLAPAAMQLLHLAAADAVWITAVLFASAATQPFTTFMPASG
jgi:heme A synthase